ncbi:MAG: hypothetical protein ACLP7P_07750, partial [Rhodomicrobium sp.]
ITSSRVFRIKKSGCGPDRYISQLRKMLRLLEDKPLWNTKGGPARAIHLLFGVHRLNRGTRAEAAPLEVYKSKHT